MRPTVTSYYAAFSLVELMIVLAIIGILASIAIPSYQDYTVRAKVSEGLVLGSSLKNQLAEYYLSQGEFPFNNAALGYSETGSEFTGKYVNTVVVSGTRTEGIIKITFGGGTTVPNVLHHKKVLLKVTQTNSFGSLVWSCSPAPGTQGVAVQYLPADCRNNA